MAQWEFDVIDKMSSPLKAMDTNLGSFEKQLKLASNELDKLERAARVDEISKMEDPMKRQIATLRMFKDDLLHVAEAQKKAKEEGIGLRSLFSDKAFFAFEMAKNFLHLAESVGHSALEFVHWTAEAAQFRAGALATFDLMLNGKEAAEEEFGALEQIARGTAMTKQQVMDQYRELFSFTDRFGTKATEDVIAAGADIQKALGTQQAGAFVMVMRNIEAMGGLNTRMIRQLRETGIATPQRLYEALATEMHTTAKGAEGLIKAHKISQEHSINTLLKLVQDRIDKGGALGEFSLERSKGNIDDQVKNLKRVNGVDVRRDQHGSDCACAGGTGKAFDPATASGRHMRDIANQKAFRGISDAIKFTTSAHGYVSHNGWTRRFGSLRKWPMAFQCSYFKSEKAGLRRG